MNNHKAIKEFGIDFVNKVNRLRKLFNAQKVVIINEVQTRRAVIEKQAGKA